MAQVEKPCPSKRCNKGVRVVAVIKAGEVAIPVPAPCPVCSGWGTVFVHEPK